MESVQVLAPTWRAGLAWKCAVAALVLCSAASRADANTYLFTVSAGDLLTALHAQEGDTIFNESGYFAIFVQPSAAQVPNYAYGSVLSPNPGGDGYNDQWASGTIDDPSSPSLGYGPNTNYYSQQNCTNPATCTWAYWSKQAGQTNVMLFSDANNGGAGNIFLNHTFHDALSPPYGWGTTTATIKTANSSSSSAALQFYIDTPSTLTGSITLLGYASELRSTSSTSFPPFGPTEHDGVPFTLSETPLLVGTPEPSTWALSSAALVGLVAVWRRRKARGPSRRSY
jgi:hypothetical protein